MNIWRHREGRECVTGDIIYIQNDLYLVTDVKRNINCVNLRDGNFDYFGKQNPYILVTSAELIIKEISSESMKLYKKEMERMYNEE